MGPAVSVLTYPWRGSIESLGEQPVSSEDSSSSLVYTSSEEYASASADEPRNNIGVWGRDVIRETEGGLYEGDG
jgi:hypothetical protein